MKAVLMAGGSGTRLRPLTCSLPKPMVPIVNKPIIGHIVDLLKTYGIKDIIVTLHYLPTVIENYLKNGSDQGVNIAYSIEEGAPLGTAGCVKNISDKLTETFMVISGDALTDFNLDDAIKFHKEKGSKATLILTRVPDPLDFGVVITDNEGRIERFLEKPTSSEIFSDTINTGIYILEPEVLDYLPANAEKDFSKDLFPLLLKNGDPIYGYVAEGYWCDVGSLETYRSANYDVLNGKVKIKMPYEQKTPGIWTGESVVIEPSAKLEAPIVIGNNCYIGKNSKISANTIIGDSVIISEEASLKRPILWNGIYIDKRVELSGCIIAKNTTVKLESHILEGAVIGEDCNVGQKVTIKTGVRIWPAKNLESGSILKDSLVWGAGAQKSLFAQGGVKGFINLDISPELTVKVGAAYGATVGMGKSVVMSRDQSPAARLVSRGLFSGILSVGVDIRNLEETSIPITRYRIGSFSVAGGIHIRSDAEDPEKVSIEFLDSSGLNIAPSLEKKIESTYYKEDFRRAMIEEIGEINYPARVKEKYIEGFMEQFAGFTSKKPLKIVLDYAYKLNAVVLPGILGKLGMDTVVLNAHFMSRPQIDKEKLTKQLSEVVVALNADFGVIVDDDGERMILVDNEGQIVGNNKLLALMTRLVVEDNPGKPVVVPVNYPNVIDQIVEKYDSKTIMTKAGNRYLMEAAMSKDAVFAGRNDGRFIFPQFHCGFDAMFSIAMLAKLISSKETSISRLIADIPPINYKFETIPCMTEQKGTVIRNLVEKTRGLKVDLLDGIKIHSDDGSWVLVLPDATEPLINMYADG
ncbi:MAG: NTP transferase domain-containing protein, partial [Candidatus Sericytochromatia bacterium]|nr:NTP transferase domain-containing protein [Candidatus Sericytochromatia bacterium]